MEQRTGSRKAARDRTTEERLNGQSIWVLPAGKQFYTRSCTRCAGLLVSDWCYDLDNTGEYNVEVLHCVQCGTESIP